MHSKRPTERPTLYLSFDDGPDPKTTPSVLSVLKNHSVEACFFLIAERATHERRILKDVLEAGHSIGNHSLDHRYWNYFKPRRAVKDWIAHAQTLITEVSGRIPIGFRCPAGIQTPGVHWALNQLKIPLIHWKVRFYDAIHPWTWNKAYKSIDRTESGSIVLLHDRQRDENRSEFLKTLDRYIDHWKSKGFEFRALGGF